MLTDKELAELDLAVAKAEGIEIAERDPNDPDFLLRVHRHNPPDPVIGAVDHTRWQPTRNRAEAMRLLEKYRLVVGKLVGPVPDEWLAYRNDGTPQDGRGPTPAIAICRAVVALSGTPQRSDTQDRRGKV